VSLKSLAGDQTLIHLFNSPESLAMNILFEFIGQGGSRFDIRFSIYNEENYEVNSGCTTGPSDQPLRALNTLYVITATYDAVTKVSKIYVDGSLRKQCAAGLYAAYGPRALLFSYLGQDPYIINGTVADNVVFGSHQSKIIIDKIKQALDLAAFTLPETEGDLLDTPVGDHGSKLSEGQKHRLALARAIYHDSEIFILDEPTSALDDETEAQLLNNLLYLKNLGKTMLIIAHREKVFDICDVVYTLEEKRLTPYMK
jgi:ABC-type lipoprotein export system ATPase subunit